MSDRKCIRPIVTIPFSSCLTCWWSIESKIFLNESLICSRERFSCIIFPPIHCHVHSSAAQYISGVQWSLYFDFVVIHPFFRNAKAQLFFNWKNIFTTPLSARLPSLHGEVSLAFRKDTNALTHSYIRAFLKRIHTLTHSACFAGFVVCLRAPLNKSNAASQHR